MYQKEIAPHRLDTWQPPKLMEILLQEDPNADSSGTISIGLEKTPGEPAEHMHVIGHERVTTTAELKSSYHSLGSFLHTRTIDQTTRGRTPTEEKIRARCEGVAEIVRQVLGSKVQGFGVAARLTFDCLRCKEVIVKRVRRGAGTVTAECIMCSAPHRIRENGDDTWSWEADVVPVKCANPDCEGQVELWRDGVTEGTVWTCDGCGSENRICLGVMCERRTGSAGDSPMDDEPGASG